MHIKKINSISPGPEAELFTNAYLRLFNDPQNLKFISFTGIPFTKKIVQFWLAESYNTGVEYYTAISDNNDICAIACTRKLLAESFEIIALVVDDRWRRSGIGGLLIDTAIDVAKQSGFKAIQTAVFADNKNMLSLVIKKDFKANKIEYHTRWDGEDIIYFKRYL